SVHAESRSERAEVRVDCGAGFGRGGGVILAVEAERSGGGTRRPLSAVVAAARGNPAEVSGGEFRAHSGDAVAGRASAGAGDGDGWRIDQQPADAEWGRRRGGAGERRTEPGARPGDAEAVSRSCGGDAGGRRIDRRAAGDARFGGGILRRGRADSSGRSHG